MMWAFGLFVLCVAALGAAMPGAERFDELRKPPEQTSDPLPKLDAPDLATWEGERKKILAAWKKILGPMPARVPLEAQVLSREGLEDHSRLLLRYRNDAKSSCEAYLLIPKGFEGKRPGVVCLHPTSKTTIKDPVGLANREAVHHALHLVRRGYVCIAPANFLWDVPGRSWKESAAAVLKEGTYTTGMAKMLFDAMRAVDVLVERAEVDASRIGAIGHSLGGKEALYLAAFDPRIVAAISCEGGVGLSMSNWGDEHYLGKQISSPDFRRGNHEVMALVAPRGLLIIGGESADGAKSWPYVEAVLPVWRLYQKEERLGLLRHDEGHHFPSPGPKRELAYRWLDQWLSAEEKSNGR
jgi:hypothetical protein